MEIDSVVSRHLPIYSFRAIGSSMLSAKISKDGRKGGKMKRRKAGRGREEERREVKEQEERKEEIEAEINSFKLLPIT